MENQNRIPKKPDQHAEEELTKEMGSNLTGTARPAKPDEKEILAHHGKKPATYPPVQNTDALIANVDENAEDKKS